MRFSPRFWLALPRFLWRGKWFWGAWLLIFLLPQTRDEARLHFLGSRFTPRMYGQPWQERWMSDADDPRVTLDMTPLERALWHEQRQNPDGFANSYDYASDPGNSVAGRLVHRFPREGWLRALALGSIPGWNSMASQKMAIAWARRAMPLDPHNAFYPLVLARAMGDLGRRAERESLLQRAAGCPLFDDGSASLKRVLVSAAGKAGVSTWMEQNEFYSHTGSGSFAGTLDSLAGQLVVMSQRDIAKKRAGPALSRSRAMMRVALLLQSTPCGSDQWREGESWARFAWSVALPSSRVVVRRWGMPSSTAQLADFEPFARQHGDSAGVTLARQCAARIHLIKAATGSPTQLGEDLSNLLLGQRSPWNFFWSVSNGLGMGVLFFAGHLLGWWLQACIVNWRAVGRESTSFERAGSGTAVMLLSLVGFLALYVWFYKTLDVPAFTRMPFRMGQYEVMTAAAGLSFFSPPLLLALWCVIRARWQNRALLRLPARQQIEMRLSPIEGWLLSNATGAFFGVFLLLSLIFAAIWAYMNWQALSYDWLRAILPNISTRTVPTFLTSLESPLLPAYSALCLIAMTFEWLASWRFVVGQERRVVYHGGLRAWKEALGCALTATVWLYFALMLGSHFSGETLKARLSVAAAQGEGALIPGFNAPGSSTSTTHP